MNLHKYYALSAESLEYDQKTLKKPHRLRELYGYARAVNMNSMYVFSTFGSKLNSAYRQLLLISNPQHSAKNNSFSSVVSIRSNVANEGLWV